MATQFRYCAFISYSHKDEKWASWLHKSLETYRVPKHLLSADAGEIAVFERLGKVFRDREELPSSHDLGDKLTQALADSASLVVICSPRAAQSRWTNEEILAYKRLGREDRILCLIVGGEPNASVNPATVGQECFPPALRYRLGPDGELSDERAEPIAADARPQGDGKQNAKLKLIAGMLGVGFDALKQREQQRRQRRMLAITSGAVAGMMIAIGLAAYAVIQRNEAVVQKARAQQEAEIARETRDFLVGLFRVSDPSEARGNSITAREILDKGAARIDTELANQPAIQATLMETIGTVYTSLGLYAPATTLLKGAVERREKFHDPDQREVVSALERYGEVLTLKADYDKAEKLYRQALAISTQQAGAGSLEAARIKSRLADLLKRKGAYQAADPLFREALAVQRRKLGNKSPEVAQTLEGLALNLYHQGNYADPVPLLREAVALRRELHDGPHPDLAEALNNLALVMRSVGDYDEAEKMYREALKMKRFLLGDIHPEVAMGLNNLAFVAYSRGELDAAEKMYREAISIQRKLLGEDHPDIAMALNNLSFLLYDKGDAKGAIASSRASLELYRRTVGDAHPSVARGMANLGMWLAESRNAAAAEPLLQESLTLRKKLFGNQHTDVASSMTLLANLLIDTERYSEALELARGGRAIYLTALPANHWRTAVATNAEGAALAGLHKYTEAEPLLIQSHEVLSNDDEALPMFVAKATGRLAALYSDWGRPEQAAKYLAPRGGQKLSMKR